jgi:Tripartite tricarboxylate transporter TctB family
VRIRNPQDFWAGVMFTVVGTFVMFFSGRYPMGTAARMGPGYFPRMLGMLMIALGIVVAIRGLRLRGPAISRWHWRPTVVVLASVVMFGAIVNMAGLVISTIALILVASAASTEFRPREALISGAFLAALSVGVFLIGLKLSLPIWPAFLTQ